MTRVKFITPTTSVLRFSPPLPAPHLRHGLNRQASTPQRYVHAARLPSDLRAYQKYRVCTYVRGAVCREHHADVEEVQANLRDRDRSAISSSRQTQLNLDMRILYVHCLVDVQQVVARRNAYTCLRLAVTPNEPLHAFNRSSSLQVTQSGLHRQAHLPSPRRCNAHCRAKFPGYRHRPKTTQRLGEYDLLTQQSFSPAPPLWRPIGSVWPKRSIGLRYQQPS